MAQQAFLARQRRKLVPQGTQKLNLNLAGESSFGRRASSPVQLLSAGEQIRVALCNDKDRLEALFEIWVIISAGPEPGFLRVLSPTQTTPIRVFSFR